MRYASRIGRFKVAALFFVRCAPTEGANVFRDMIVLNVDLDPMTLDRQYTAVHPDFRPVIEGEVIPEYEAVFSPGTATPRWVEVK